MTKDKPTGGPKRPKPSQDALEADIEEIAVRIAPVLKALEKY